MNFALLNREHQFRLRRNDKRGDGSAVSLPRSIVGTRHCRLLRLYDSDANEFNIILNFANKKSNRFSIALFVQKHSLVFVFR